MTPLGEHRHEVRAEAGDAGERVDRVLARGLPQLTRTRIKALILEGRLSAAGATITDPAYRVKPSQSFTLATPAPVAAKAQAEAIDLAVVFEDDELIVIDKPAGLVVHPAPGNPRGTLVNALLAHCGDRLSGIGGVRRPGIVHRLDKDTSGLMVAAKSDRAHAGLAAQFAGRTIERAYLAIVWGVPSPAAGEITGNIGRSPRQRKRMAVLARGGKPALTRYRVLERFGDIASLVECRLATGRTHQVRVHLSHLRHPLVGDPTYGRGRGPAAKVSEPARGALAGLRRQALHASVLGFRHPLTGQSLRFASPLPADLATALAALSITARHK